MDAEYDLMKSGILAVVTDKYMQSQGNSFAQLTHNGDTLVRGKKVQFTGLQLVDECFRDNHVIYLCCREHKENM